MRGIMQTGRLNPHVVLIAQIKELYVDRPLVAGHIVTNVIRMDDREAELLAQLSDTPEILMATLEQPVEEHIVNAGVNWRGRLQTVLQRRLRRTPTAEEVWFDVDAAEPFVATANVVVAELGLDVHARGQPAPTKQTAIQSAARLAILTVEHHEKR